MTLDEEVAWYQKKIGTYDKQQWEKTVEQRILNGFTHVPLKNAKIRTEFIDVDLVRGSSFPKAKPKQSLLTVIRLAIVRFVFLPLYAKWWVLQTSPKIFSFFLFLYVLQMFNWAVYSFNVNKNVIPTDDGKGATTNGNDDEYIVTFTELLIPMSLSLILSMIHSQIVATASNSLASDKRKRIPQPKHRRKPERSTKRRKKPARLRTSSVIQPLGSVSESKLLQMGVKDNSSDRNSINFACDKGLKSGPSENTTSKLELDNLSVSIISSNSKLLIGRNETDCDEVMVNGNDKSPEMVVLTSMIDLNQNCSTKNIQLVEIPKELRRRNVNWESPIKSHVTVNQYHSSIYDESSEGFSIHNEISARESDTDSEEDLGHIDDLDDFDANVRTAADQTAGDDDGFESLNGKSSSGEENGNVNGCVDVGSLKNCIEKPVQYSRGNEAIDPSDLEDVKDEVVGGISMAKLNDKVLSQKSSKIVLNSTGNDLRSHHQVFSSKQESSDTDEEGDDGESMSLPGMNTTYTEGTTSATEWIGITTNSEECSYSSADIDRNSDSQIECSEGGSIEYDYFTPTVILNPSCGLGDRISCTIWDGREAKKAEMSVLDISSAIIERVEGMPETCDYVYIGVTFSIVLSLVPAFCRLCEAAINSSDSTEINFLDLPALLMEKTSYSTMQILMLAFGDSMWQNAVLAIDFFLRLFLTFLFFFLLAVAERTFKQRFLYAKLFSHLTSSRRARKSELPHFRLNKVRNIKTWLSVRSYLKRRGPQRSVDVIVSAAFILTLLLLAFLSVEWLKDSVQLQSQHNLEALIWSCALGCFILRFMTLGTKINRKYRSISVLITEQINLYLQIEQKPHNKEELMVSNSVLKLAADLLKELESPFKISGLSANPYLYTTVKVVILSALSGVLSEMLGFKLKLHKIKIK